MQIVNIIQSMLAPGVMISACGLLILGMNNKYSIVVNRIRLLDEEERRLIATDSKSSITEDEEMRLANIERQVEKLNARLLLVRNAVLSYTLAVGFFIISSFFIGLQFSFPGTCTDGAALLLFLAGKLSVLTGITYAAREVWKGYEIVQIELHECAGLPARQEVDDAS